MDETTARQVAAGDSAEHDADHPGRVNVNAPAVVVALVLLVGIVALGVYGLSGWLAAGNVGVTIRPQ
jgi:hypothetical protein